MAIPVPMPKVVPTDNLYRFFALFWLAIAISCIVALVVQVSQHNAKVIPMLGKRAADAVRLKAIQDNSNQLKKAVDDLRATLGTTTQRDATSPRLPSSDVALPNSIQDRLSKIDGILNDGKEEAAAIEAEDAKDLTEAQSSKIVLDSNMNVAGWGFAVALSLSMVGFGMWYYNLQRYRDKLLQLNVELKERELEERKLLQHSVTTKEAAERPRRTETERETTFGRGSGS